MANDYFRTMQNFDSADMKYPERKKAHCSKCSIPELLNRRIEVLSTLFESRVKRENMEERSSPITYDTQMRYYENLFNEMLSQRTDLIYCILSHYSKLNRVVREFTVKRESRVSSWGPAWGTNWDPFWGI